MYSWSDQVLPEGYWESDSDLVRITKGSQQSQKTPGDCRKVTDHQGLFYNSYTFHTPVGAGNL